MPNGHGGYRKPANPAPVSGPGQHSRRTDGGPAGHPSQVMSTAPDQPYGAQKEQLDQQRAVPMAGAQPLPGAAPVPPGGGSATPYSGGGFADPSARPHEPITTGVNIGPGPGSEALPQSVTPPNPGAGTGQMTQLLQRLSATDTTGIIGQLYQAAQARGA